MTTKKDLVDNLVRNGYSRDYLNSLQKSELAKLTEELGILQNVASNNRASYRNTNNHKPNEHARAVESLGLVSKAFGLIRNESYTTPLKADAATVYEFEHRPTETTVRVSIAHNGESSWRHINGVRTIRTGKGFHSLAEHMGNVCRR